MLSNKLIIVYFVISNLANLISAQTWISNGPYGSTISTITVSPADTNIVYAGTKAAGIYRSTNGGDYWEAINKGIPIITDTIIGSPTEPSWWDGDYHHISAIKISPFNTSRLYAGTGGSGIIQSFDHGNNWIPTNTGLPDSAVVSALWLHPLDSTFLLCGTAYPAGGLYKSTDGGFNWTLLDSVPHGNTYWITTIENHPLNPDTIYVGISSAGEPGFAWGLWRTSDSGNTWDILNEMLTFNEITIDPNDPLKMWSWIMNDFGTFLLLYSNDGGYSWNPYPDIINFWDGISLLYADPNWNLYVIDDEYNNLILRKSTDHGQSWDSLSIPFSPVDIAANHLNTQIVYFGSSIAPYRSEDGGQTFAIEDSGMINTYIYDVAINPKNPQIIYTGGEQGFWKSINIGTGWTRLGTNLVNSLAIDSKYPDTLYVGGDGLMRSYDGGNTWQNIGTNISGTITALEVHPESTNIVFVGAYPSTLYKSTDWGNSWSISYSPPQGSFWIADIAINPDDSQIMYFGSINNSLTNGFYKSIDGGNSWNSITNLDEITSIAIDPSNPETVYIATKNKIMASFNGSPFSEIGQTISSQHMSKVTLDTLNPSHIYVGTKDKGVFYSHDAGQNWQRISGDYNVRIRDIDLVPHENRMFLGTNGFGVWRGDDVLVNIEDDENKRVIALQALKLLPAYPNPFNPTTTIAYQLPERSRVKLKIYDITGRQVKTLKDGVQPAGNYQTTWDGTNEYGNAVSSGVYVYRLIVRAGSSQYESAKKMLLLR